MYVRYVWVEWKSKNHSSLFNVPDTLEQNHVAGKPQPAHHIDYQTPGVDATDPPVS